MSMNECINDMNDRFHTTDLKFAQYTRNTISNALRDEKITEDDATLIDEYLTEVAASRNIKPCRKFKLASILKHLRGFIPPFRSCTMVDIYRAIEGIRLAKNEAGKQRFSPDTIADYMRILKRFFTWMAESKYAPNIQIEKLKKIQMPAYGSKIKTAEQMISETEVKSMIESCRNSRDRAIVALLFESGIRIGEMGTLRWDQVKFNDWSVVINVKEKTKFTRYIPLVVSRSYLSQWMNDYPGPIQKNGFVFVTFNQHRQLQYHQIAKQLREIALRAGIKKHISPHLLRHSRITNMIQRGLHESIIKKIMWGHLGTEQLANYAHLSDSDIDAEIAKMNGIVCPEVGVKKASLDPRQCGRCFTVNAPTFNFCSVCGLPLTDEYRNETLSATTQIDKYATTPQGVTTAMTALKRTQENSNHSIAAGVQQ